MTLLRSTYPHDIAVRRRVPQPQLHLQRVAACCDSGLMSLADQRIYNEMMNQRYAVLQQDLLYDMYIAGKHPQARAQSQRAQYVVPMLAPSLPPAIADRSIRPPPPQPHHHQQKDLNIVELQRSNIELQNQIAALAAALRLNLEQQRLHSITRDAASVADAMRHQELRQREEMQRQEEVAAVPRAPRSVTVPVRSTTPPTRAPSAPCGRASSMPDEKLKTEICRSWEETGECKYMGRCRFAHGFEELRVVDRHPKYKTQICVTFRYEGFCSYGKRCCFIHVGANDAAPIVERPAEGPFTRALNRSVSI